MGKFKNLFTKKIGEVEEEKTGIEYIWLRKEVKALMETDPKMKRFMERKDMDEMLVDYTITKYESNKVFSVSITSNEACPCCRMKYITAKIELPLTFKWGDEIDWENE